MLIHFYEKPGCINNTKQKDILRKHGHLIVAHSLLEQKWDEATLRLFFRNMPVNEWFNVSAPSIKNGDIKPSEMDEESALKAMIENPLLIKRPLIDAYGELSCGFDSLLVKSLLGESTDISHVLSCPNSGKDTKCN